MAELKELREWTRPEDKEKMGPGEWQNEPDKRQWVDEGTNFDALMVRNHAGAWCGYVGVPKDHPWFGKDYSSCTLPTPCEESYCGHSPESVLSVHGGITFAADCHEPTEEQWLAEAGRINDQSLHDAATLHPKGDSAQLLARLEREKGFTFDEWREARMAERICHLARPEVGEVWWFGFDCIHSGDYGPVMARQIRNLVGESSRHEWETYRNVEYVESEVAKLAEQLHAVQEWVQ